MNLEDKIGIGFAAGVTAVAAAWFLGPFYYPLAAAKYIAAGAAGGMFGSGIYSAVNNDGNKH